MPNTAMALLESTRNARGFIFPRQPPATDIQHASAGCRVTPTILELEFPSPKIALSGIQINCACLIQPFKVLRSLRIVARICDLSMR